MIIFSVAVVNLANSGSRYMYSKLENREEIIMAVHQALVEVFTLKQANLPLLMDANPSTKVPADTYLRWLAEDASFETTEDGETRLVLESEELQDAILDSITPKAGNQHELAVVMPEDEVNRGEVEERNRQQMRASGRQDSSLQAVEQQNLELDQPEEQATTEALAQSESGNMTETYEDLGPIAPANSSWRNVPLVDESIKFAVSHPHHDVFCVLICSQVLKRVMQLTGTRIPDPEIASITTSRILLTHLVKKPKPRKLADNLVAGTVAELPNVQVSKRRYGLIDKEKEVGRWKLIKQELERLDLQSVKGRGVGRKAAIL